MSNGAGEAQGDHRISLSQVSLPRLVFSLLRQRFSGTVMAQQSPPHMGNRTVWFRGGMPVFTDWVVPESVLGQVLITTRTIAEDQLLRALEAMAIDGGLLGQHLIALGIIDRPKLLEGLREQCARKLIHPFSLRAGEAHITVGEPPDLEADLQPVNVLGLILSGVGAAFDEERIVAELGPVLHAPLQATASLAKYRNHFPFRPTDQPIVGALLQGSRLDELCALPGVSPRRAMQIIYTLWACQMLRATGAAPKSAAPTPAVVSTPAAAPTPAPPISAAPPISSASSFVSPAAAPASAPSRGERPRSQTLTDNEVVLTPETTEAPPDEDSFLIELAELEKKIGQGVHAFALFDLPTTAQKREVRHAWGDLSRKYHPDALKSLGRTDLHDRVNDVFAALSEAQQLLGDAEQRAALRESVERGEFQTTTDGKDATAQAHAVFQSELLAKEADKLLRSNHFARALERYREAATYNADEPDILAATAWCEYQVSGKGPDDALRSHEQLMAILEESPKIARAHYFLGFVLIDEGNLPAAIDSFTRASKLDPRNIDAERQIRALKMKLGRAPSVSRGNKKDKGGRLGGLKGLFGRKK